METSAESNDKEAARIKGIELCYNTPLDKIPELTWLNRRETFIYPIIGMFSNIHDMNRRPGSLMGGYVSLATRYRRSLAGQHLQALQRTVLTELTARQMEEEGMEEEEP